MIMQILVNHVRVPDDEIDSKLHDSESNTDDVITSLLDAVSSLTLPLDDIDDIISVLQDQKNFWALKMGDSACDIVEHEGDEIAVSKAIDVGTTAAENLRSIRKLISAMNKYREAAINAGAK